MDCLIYYELVERSYENDLLIKTELEKRGYRVVLCNLYWRDFWKCLFYQPKIIMLTACRNTEQMAAQFPFFFKKRAVFVNIQEEQIAFSSDFDLNLFMPQGRAKEAFHFSWGEFSDDYMRRAGVRTSHVIKMKPFQFDLCQKEFRDYFFSRAYIAEQYKLDIHKKWVLFASDFCISAQYNTEELLQRLCENLNDNYRKVYYAEVQMQQMLYEWWDRYLSEHENVIVIYRQHPSELKSLRLIDKLCSNHDNFVCHKDYSIKQWIHVVDIYTTWISSSVMEAYYADIPCFALGDSERIVEDGIAIPLFDYDKYISDYETFEKIMNDPQNYRDDYLPISQPAIKKYYGEHEDGFAYLKICDYIDELLKDKKQLKQSQLHLTKEEMKTGKKERWINICTTFYNDLFCFLKPILWYLIPHKKESIIKFERDLKRFDKKDLQEKERNIKRVLKNIDEKKHDLN